MAEPYAPKSIETAAQQFWEQNKSFQAADDPNKEKFYCLSMLPYPSGDLHMGHVRNYTIGDVASRYHALLGKNVLQPMGWDAFGLPAENAALKHKVPPSQWIQSSIVRMKGQLQSMGYAYDWSREIATCEPNYYRWEQWLFTKLLEKGLVYRKKSAVNWDPVDQTVLANEQVVDGKGWRSGAPIERKEISQWFLKITDYADELLEDLDNLDQWPDHVKTMQRNWIGRSQGTQITFKLEHDPSQSIQVFTTRADTLMGVPFLGIAAQHPLAQQAAQDNQAIQDFIDSCEHTKVSEAELATLDKKGIATPFHAIHPLTQANIPIWIGNFVLADYGTGAVMAVPAHDQRDHEFATAYKLPIPPVIQAPEGWDYQEKAYGKEGLLIHSGDYNGMTSKQAQKAIAEKLVDMQQGEIQTQYRLRDWGISRQRYWGCPIPIMYDQDGNSMPVPEQDLPVTLPTDVTLASPQSPLTTLDSFIHTTSNGQPCTRETDTFDTFVESSWYYLRYCCPNLDTAMLDDSANYWAPVDLYIGGVEHAIMHLLYARFMHKLLRDIGLIESDEPFKQLLTQGMVLKDGAKMSKSKGNTVDPTGLIDQYGADTLRFFVVFAAPPEQSFEWSEGGVEGSYRYLKRLWQFAHQHQAAIQKHHSEAERNDWSTLSPELESLRYELHKTLQQATHDMEKLQLNTVASSCMKALNYLTKIPADDSSTCLLYEGMRQLLIMLNPITPHITHTLWQQLNYGDNILEAQWPTPDPIALNARSQLTVVVQINGKKRGEIQVAPDADQDSCVQLIQQCESLNQYLNNKTIIKVIHIPNKLVNMVVK
jgi:leucyl-tRNA synthetase